MKQGRRRKRRPFPFARIVRRTASREAVSHSVSEVGKNAPRHPVAAVSRRRGSGRFRGERIGGDKHAGHGRGARGDLGAVEGDDPVGLPRGVGTVPEHLGVVNRPVTGPALRRARDPPHRLRTARSSCRRPRTAVSRHPAGTCSSSSTERRSPPSPAGFAWSPRAPILADRQWESEALAADECDLAQRPGERKPC